jgi:hypothetical protein
MAAMKYPTCKTCKHYVHALLDRFQHDPNYGKCTSDMVNWDTTPVDGILVNGGCGNDYEFAIGPDFGCIHHEERADA